MFDGTKEKTSAKLTAAKRSDCSKLAEKKREMYRWRWLVTLKKLHRRRLPIHTKRDWVASSSGRLSHSLVSLKLSFTLGRAFVAAMKFNGQPIQSRLASFRSLNESKGRNGERLILWRFTKQLIMNEEAQKRKKRTSTVKTQADIDKQIKSIEKYQNQGLCQARRL